MILFDSSSTICPPQKECLSVYGYVIVLFQGIYLGTLISHLILVSFYTSCAYSGERLRESHKNTSYEEMNVIPQNKHYYIPLCFLLKLSLNYYRDMILLFRKYMLTFTIRRYLFPEWETTHI